MRIESPERKGIPLPDPGSAGGAFPGQCRTRSGALCVGKNQGVLLSHAGNSGTPDGTASEPTYVCPPLVW